jgi:hypothetical protein
VHAVREVDRPRASVIPYGGAGVAGSAIAEARGEMHVVFAAVPLLLLSLPTPSWSTDTTAPPAGAQPEPDDALKRKPVTMPFNGTTDVTGRCGILTNFRSAGEGCDLTGRIGGRHVYFVDGFGFFNTPEFERHVQQGGQELTVIDPRSPSVYYGQIGIGFGIWPTRQIGVHLETAAFGGAIYSRAAPSLPTEGAFDIAVGALATIGADYRIRSWPWAFGFDYRVQSIPYVGLSDNGEKSLSPDVVMRSTAMDVGHFFMVSITFRREDDRND